ncbi:dihydrofolate reductase family protein [Pedobacter glucosidilyticus]|uniref:dihydrofolate reductase family protein n=1 Tax=Pedobacter glucosidilyticus TaxID=1122941 RepID=UPI0026EF7F35|nr:dihydrofolate reductase family protein [Pedobacter glucosidilyticus]
MMRKVNLYIAMSLDGYIATESDNIDFLSMVESVGEDYGHQAFMDSIDTVIWGRKTFDKILTFGDTLMYPDKKIYVMSKQRKGDIQHITYRDDVVVLINELKQQEGKDIYCDGGAEIVDELLKHQLIDRIIVSIIPHLLGSGKSLFKNGRLEQRLKFKKSETYPTGLVQLWYDVKPTS